LSVVWKVQQVVGRKPIWRRGKIFPPSTRMNSHENRYGLPPHADEEAVSEAYEFEHPFQAEPHVRELECVYTVVRVGPILSRCCNVVICHDIWPFCRKSLDRGARHASDAGVARRSAPRPGRLVPGGQRPDPCNGFGLSSSWRHNRAPRPAVARREFQKAWIFAEKCAAKCAVKCAVKCAGMLDCSNCQPPELSVQKKSYFIVQQRIGMFHVRLGAGVRLDEFAILSSMVAATPDAIHAAPGQSDIATFGDDIGQAQGAWPTADLGTGKGARAAEGSGGVLPVEGMARAGPPDQGGAGQVV